MTDPLPVGELRPGFYRLRLVRGGVWVPAELRYGPPLDPETGEVLDRSWRWLVILDGQWCEDAIYHADEGGESAAFIWRVAHSHPVDRGKYEEMIGDARWCRQNAPGLPEANPTRKIDLARMESLF